MICDTSKPKWRQSGARQRAGRVWMQPNPHLDATAKPASSTAIDLGVSKKEFEPAEMAADPAGEDHGSYCQM